MSEKIRPNLRERLLYAFSPERGARRYRERAKQAHMNDIKAAAGATGYGNHGASRTLTSLIGWLPGGGSAEDDIDLHGSALRIRARDLYAGGGLAKSGISTLTTNTVGWGIKPKPKPDGQALGLTDEQCDEWERNALREFNLWAESKFCDAERSKDFYTIQELAFRNMLMSGDVFVLFGMTGNKANPYETTLRLLEADRISTPDSSEGVSEVKELDSGGRIVDGVETDAQGAVVRYHIASRHPLAGENSSYVEWTAIDAEGGDTGEPNILHILTFERPEQRRGIPFVAAQIEQIKQLDRYINSELAANVVAAMLTAFLESEEDNGLAGMEDAIDESEKVTDEELKLELAPGAIYDLPPGKKIQTVNPIRSNAAFESFVAAQETIIGSSMGVPKEVLIKKYDSNYTAARSSLLDFWKTVKVYRNSFVNQFCRPVYEAWLAEAVAKGRVEAPGFFDDPATRKAWCGCMWNGISMGHVDPIKEANAAEKRIKLHMSTEEQEAAEYNGGNWEEIITQRRKEINAARELGEIVDISPDAAQTDTDDEEEDDA